MCVQSLGGFPCMPCWLRWLRCNNPGPAGPVIRRVTMAIEFAMLIACVGVLVAIIALAVFID